MKSNLSLVRALSLLMAFSLYASMASGGLLPQDGEALYELEFWESIQNSTDAEDYEAYLEAYPDGRFAPLARSRAERYREEEASERTQPAPAVTDMDIHYDVVTDANVREAPTAHSSKLGLLKKGDQVLVTGQVVGKPWYRIKTDDGVTGYVYGELLRQPPPQAQTYSPPPSPAKPPPGSSAKTAATAGGPEDLRDCPVCPAMIKLPPGSFTMGDPRGDRSEKPAHKVSIREPFAIGKYEVTTAQWQACVEAGGCSHRLKDDPAPRSPVRDISWSDAQEYIRWLSRTTGESYRLPTEAEWEYATRAGTDTRYWWGEHIGKGNANCKDCGGDWDHDAPAVVDAYAPNPFGLYGTNGGVWEWVADCWHRNYNGAPRDGSRWDKPDCREYVIRGGAWRNDSTYVHSASRFKYDAYVRYLLNGFRVARSLP